MSRPGWIRGSCGPLVAALVRASTGGFVAASNARGLEILRGEVAHLAREVNFICANLSRISDAHVITLEIEHFHEAQRIAL